MAWYMDLEYKWVHPSSDWTCESRQFDSHNDYVKIKLRIPWIKWPVVEKEIGRENRIPGAEICDRAVRATDKWALLLRKKVDGEEFARHEGRSCIIQMHETLLHTIHTLPIEFQYLRLFYGCVADRVAKLSEVAGLKMDQIVFLEEDGRYRIEEDEGYTARLREDRV
ncbi:hypothetical protein NCS52_01088200 [Fusarium sp. LHS14.1]|nr:hypothetical protein NCS52_01088200 [Fusarium sp. LHS14.1]